MLALLSLPDKAWVIKEAALICLLSHWQFGLRKFMLNYA
ncbi:MAG: hypothetical protein QOI11_2243 [Candidatus Eremiobacteraeota bacterium]|nr:hypothetical protein [Candidatus Eremiobacteraeota bacterium]